MIALSDSQKQLKELLQKVKNTDDFFWGVYCLVKNPPQLDAMIKFLEDNPDVDDQTVLFFAFELKEMQEIPQGTKEYNEKVKA